MWSEGFSKVFSKSSARINITILGTGVNVILVKVILCSSLGVVPMFTSNHGVVCISKLHCFTVNRDVS